MLTNNLFPDCQSPLLITDDPLVKKWISEGYSKLYPKTKLSVLSCNQARAFLADPDISNTHDYISIICWKHKDEFRELGDHIHIWNHGY